MDFLNSQHLTSQDGYLHVFRQPGKYPYQVLFLPSGFEASEPGRRSYLVEATDMGHKEGAGTQYDVVLRWDEKERAYRADPEELRIGVNDFVLWRVESSTPGIPPYSVHGGSDGEGAFDSRALGRHDVFTHLFMMPGEYRFTVSGQGGGVIVVADHRKLSPEAYEKAAAAAPVIQVLGVVANPARVEIVAGQTAVWFVEEGDKIDIRAVTKS